MNHWKCHFVLSLIYNPLHTFSFISPNIFSSPLPFSPFSPFHSFPALYYSTTSHHSIPALALLSTAHHSTPLQLSTTPFHPFPFLPTPTHLSSPHYTPTPPFTSAGYFRLNQTSGEIVTAQSLSEGNYTLTIGLSDRGKPSLQSENQAIVRIVVMPGNNHAPEWQIPNATHYTFSVYEVRWSGSDGEGEGKKGHREVDRVKER